MTTTRPPTRAPSSPARQADTPGPPPKARAARPSAAAAAKAADAQLDATLRLIPGYDPFSTAGDAELDRPLARKAIDFFAACLQHVEGGMANQPFVLEPWQQAIIGNLFGWLRTDDHGRRVRRYREAFIFVPRKNGKMLGMDTLLPTPTGWTKMGDLRPGDRLFDERGKPSTVLAVHPVDPRPESYRVTFSNGEVIKACGDHLWLTTARIDAPGVGVGARQTALFTGKPRGSVRSMTRLRTTREILQTQTAGGRGDRNHSVAMPAPLDLPDAELPIDPYVLGVWLGDGDSESARLTCARADAELFDHLRLAGCAVGPANAKSTSTVLTCQMGGIDICPRGHDPAEYNGSHCRACERELDRARRRGEPMPPVTHLALQAKLRALGVLNNKHVPVAYLRASYDQRLALLQGLMDTDGTASKAGQCEFSSSIPRLAEQALELLATFGIKATARWRDTRCSPSCRITFHTALPVFRLSRKLGRLKSAVRRAGTVQVASVERIDPEPMRCITVDSPSGLYLCGRSMLPTHNTPLVAGICNYVLFCDGEPGAQIYSAAAEKEQAALIYRHAVGMILREPELDRRARIYKAHKSVVLKSDQASVYKVLSADADTKHGGNSHLVMIDELHAQPNRELVDVLETSMASANRAQPLMIHLTTSDFDRPSICNEKHDYASKVRDGVITDPRFLPVIYEAQPNDDWTDPAVWAKANPNLGVSVSLEYLTAKCKQAQDTPSFENTFRRLHLNQRTKTDRKWLDLGAWDRCNGPVDEQALAGRPCYAGLDLSTKIDVTAFVLVFPPTADDALYRVLPRFFIPGDNGRQRERRDRVPYETWAKQGLITLTDGNVVDYDVVKAAMAADARRFEIREIGYDGWNATQIALQMQEQGATMVEFRQGYRSLSEPAKELEKLVLSTMLAHGGNPVLRWMAGNASVESDAAGNIMPSKRKSTERIDGIVATVMALGRAMLRPAEMDAASQFMVL